MIFSITIITIVHLGLLSTVCRGCFVFLPFLGVSKISVLKTSEMTQADFINAVHITAKRRSDQNNLNAIKQLTHFHFSCFKNARSAV